MGRDCYFNSIKWGYHCLLALETCFKVLPFNFYIWTRSYIYFHLYLFKSDFAIVLLDNLYNGVTEHWKCTARTCPNHSFRCSVDKIDSKNAATDVSQWTKPKIRWSIVLLIGFEAAWCAGKAEVKPPAANMSASTLMQGSILNNHFKTLCVASRALQIVRHPLFLFREACRSSFIPNLIWRAETSLDPQKQNSNITSIGSSGSIHTIRILLWLFNKPQK